MNKLIAVFVIVFVLFCASLVCAQDGVTEKANRPMSGFRGMGGPGGFRGGPGMGRPEITSEMKEKFEARKPEFAKKFAEMRKDGKKIEVDKRSFNGRGREGAVRGHQNVFNKRKGHEAMRGRGLRGKAPAMGQRGPQGRGMQMHRGFQRGPLSFDRGGFGQDRSSSMRGRGGRGFRGGRGR